MNNFKAKATNAITSICEFYSIDIEVGFVIAGIMHPCFDKTSMSYFHHEALVKLYEIARLSPMRRDDVFYFLGTLWQHMEGLRNDHANSKTPDVVISKYYTELSNVVYDRIVIGIFESFGLTGDEVLDDEDKDV